MTGLEIVVDGRWLSLEGLYGVDSMSTVWPGGSDELLWTPDTRSAHRESGGEPVEALYGGVPVWAGTLGEPDASQPQLSAQGAFRDAIGWPALDGSGNATTTADAAISQAITDGLNWTLPSSIGATATSIDISQGPVDLATLLDTRADNNGFRWGVDPLRQAFSQFDPTTPTYQMYSTAGLGFDLTNYASTLIGRYLDSGTSTYKTVEADGDGSHGVKRVIVDLTSRGAITAAKATSILTNLLSLGRAVPTWTAPLTAAYGQIFNLGFTPVALETVAAGDMLRIHGGYDLAQRLNGQMYLDIVIGQTTLADGLLTIQPIGFVGGRTLEDAMNAQLAAIARRKK